MPMVMLLGKAAADALSARPRGLLAEAAAGVELLPGDGAALVAPGAAALVGAPGTELGAVPLAPDELCAAAGRTGERERADRKGGAGTTGGQGDDPQRDLQQGRRHGQPWRFPRVWPAAGAFEDIREVTIAARPNAVDPVVISGLHRRNAWIISPADDGMRSTAGSLHQRVRSRHAGSQRGPLRCHRPGVCPRGRRASGARTR